MLGSAAHPGAYLRLIKYQGPPLCWTRRDPAVSVGITRGQMDSSAAVTKSARATLLAALLPMWIIAAAVGAGCKYTNTVFVGRYISSITGGSVLVRAADGTRALAVVGVTGPDSDATSVCKSWNYRIAEDRDVMWAWPGGYQMTARVARVGYSDSFISGRVTVEEGKCYRPAMSCDGPVWEAASCRLTLEPKTCEAVWFPQARYPASYPPRRCEPRQT